MAWLAPDNDREVLVTLPDGRRRVAQWCPHTEQFHTDSTYYGRGQVTHWRELPLPPSDRPTVRARAACVVAADGAYEIRGSASQSDQRLVREAGEYLCDSPTRLAWLKADVPLPEPVEAETIEAEVCDG